jgi:uncharacterized protein YoxC
MSTITWDRWDVLIWIAIFALFAFLFMLYRVIREIVPTLRQVRRTIRELEKTLQNSQEILYNMKSISRTLDEEVKEAQEILMVARGVVNQVQTVTSAIAKPITGLRNLLLGVGYGMKYLMKGDRSYEEEEV